jgi:hypothetical protein
LPNTVRKYWLADALPFTAIKVHVLLQKYALQASLTAGFTDTWQWQHLPLLPLLPALFRSFSGAPRSPDA